MKTPGLENRWLHRYATGLAVCTLFLVVAGASVTSHEAGLSVPDWPLSYGQVMPQMTGGVFFEHGHRMVATFVGMLTIGLAVWMWLKERRRWMRVLGWTALGAVILQGLLGGLTVLLLLPPAVSISHACLAQLFFSLTVVIALFTSRSWQHGPEMVDDLGKPPLRSLAIAVPAVVLAQIALGAAFRHGAFGIMPHVLGAGVVTLVILMASIFVLHQFPHHHSLRPAAMALLTITFVQVLLGVGAFFARLDASVHPLAMVIATVAHVATGALTLAASVVLAIQILRNVRVAPVEAPAEHAAVIS
ncbi:MAG TPA: COX15/CtaA family protein [Bryobacteraceae bacterium]|nr:COX15/CtaA family protein [Bryobacteraceae bacterium]